MIRNFFIIACFVIFFETLPAAAVDTDLFSGSIIASGTETSQIDFTNVIRWRPINVNFDISARGIRAPDLFCIT